MTESKPCPYPVTDRQAELLTLLHRAEAGVSGEELSRHFNVTRAAVQKWIRKLVDMGFSISGKPKAGYRLLAVPDRIDVATVRPFLATSWMAERLDSYPICGTTNQLAMEAAITGAEAGTVISAEAQTHGRGRLNRRWFSPAGQNLYFSVVLRPSLPPHRMGLLTLASAVAVAQAIRSVTGTSAMLKWPNDLLMDGRKICGILSEMSCDSEQVRWMVVGIGCNVNTDRFPEEIASIATSLLAVTGKKQNRAFLLAEILNRMETWHDQYVAKGAKPVLDAWRKWPNMLGTEVTALFTEADEKLSGIARDIDENGALVLALPDGTETTVLSGDVHLGSAGGSVGR